MYGILLLHDPESVLGVLGSIVICCGVIGVNWSQPKPTEGGEGAKPQPLPNTAHITDDSALVEMLPLVDNPPKLQTDGLADFGSSKALTDIEVQK